MQKKLNIFGLLFFALHTLVIAMIYSQHYEGSWGGFVIFVIDFPSSLIYFIPTGINQWVQSVAVGGMWWYVIGMGISAVAARILGKK